MKLPINDRLMALFMSAVAIGAGALVIHLGDKLLGIRLELFWGVSTFSPLWIVDLFVVPFIAGIVVSMIYGLGGKLLCYFSPIIVRVASYMEMNAIAPELPEGIMVLPIYYWILVLIVAIEAAAFGGVVGEIIVKRTYGRRPRYMLYKKAAKEAPGKIDD